MMTLVQRQGLTHVGLSLYYAVRGTRFHGELEAMVPKYPVQCSYQKKLLSAGSLPTRPLQPLSVTVAQSRIEQAKNVGFIETSYTHDILPTKSAARTSHPIQGSFQGLVKRFLLRAHARLLGAALQNLIKMNEKQGGVESGLERKKKSTGSPKGTANMLVFLSHTASRNHGLPVLILHEMHSTFAA